MPDRQNLDLASLSKDNSFLPKSEYVGQDSSAAEKQRGDSDYPYESKYHNDQHDDQTQKERKRDFLADTLFESRKIFRQASQ